MSFNIVINCRNINDKGIYTHPLEREAQHFLLSTNLSHDTSLFESFSCLMYQKARQKYDRFNLDVNRNINDIDKGNLILESM